MYIRREFSKKVYQETARRYLHYLGMVLKLPRKRFTKANREKQREFAERLSTGIHKDGYV